MVKIEEGDEILVGQYYVQKGSSEAFYILEIDKGPTFIYSHHVCVTKFPMKHCIHKQKEGLTMYQISKMNLQQLKAIVSEYVVEASNDNEDLDHENVDNSSESGREHYKELFTTSTTKLLFHLQVNKTAK